MMALGCDTIRVEIPITYISTMTTTKTTTTNVMNDLWAWCMCSERHTQMRKKMKNNVFISAPNIAQGTCPSAIYTDSCYITDWRSIFFLHFPSDTNDILARVVFLTDPQPYNLLKKIVNLNVYKNHFSLNHIKSFNFLYIFRSQTFTYFISACTKRPSGARERSPRTPHLRAYI